MLWVVISRVSLSIEDRDQFFIDNAEFKPLIRELTDITFGVI